MIKKGRIISFSKPWMVQAILEGKKTQTIRSLFEIIEAKTMADLNDKMEFYKKKGYGVSDIEYTTQGLSATAWKEYGKNKCIILKRPFHKVGDKVQLSFKSRSKYKGFCSNCGKGLRDFQIEEYGDKMKCCGAPVKVIPRGVFARAIIEEVFEIDIHIKEEEDSFDKMMIVDYGKDTYMFKTCIADDTVSDCLDGGKEFAERDGLTEEEFFEWFDKKYSLDVPKRFVVYRWRLLK